MTIEINTQVTTADGATATVTAINRGWATLDDGSKARVGTLTPVEAPKGRGMAKLAAYRKGYVRQMHCNDWLARLLDGIELEDIYHIGSVVLGCDEDELVERYEHLNPGQRRMNVGNRMRAAIKRDPQLLMVVANLTNADAGVIEQVTEAIQLAA